MAASTKLVLLVVALLLGVSILFYGVMFDGEGTGDLDVTEPAETVSGDGEAADDGASMAAGASPRGGDRPTLGAGDAGGQRPALGSSARRPSLSGAAPSDGMAAAETTRPALGSASRRPLAAARTAPGQIEMGAGRGSLAGGTRLPGTPPATGMPETDPDDAAATPLARPETRRPALGGSNASAGRPSSGSEGATASRTTPAPTPAAPADPSPESRRSTTTPADPADVLVSRYTIRTGDTLSLIAARHLGAARHWPLIRDANPGLDVTRLQVGQRILLPPRASVSADPAPDAAPATAAAPTRRTLRPGEVMHEVRSGETLSSIAAARLGASKHWRLIADRNRDLLDGDPHRLKVGMTLRIPPKPAD